MTTKSIIENLKTKSIPFTPKEVQEIMDEELEKDQSEMDTELVNLCADILVKLIAKRKKHQKRVIEKNLAKCY